MYETTSGLQPFPVTTAAVAPVELPTTSRRALEGTVGTRFRL